MAALPKVFPNVQPRRSMIYRKLLQAGAWFEVVNGGAVAVRYGDNAD